jgi:hypothetical protein
MEQLLAFMQATSSKTTSHTLARDGGLSPFPARHSPWYCKLATAMRNYVQQFNCAIKPSETLRCSKPHPSYHGSNCSMHS